MWTAPFQDVKMFMILSSPKCTEQSLKRTGILSECLTVAEIPYLFHPLAVLVMTCHVYLSSFVFVSNYSLLYRLMAEKYVMVLGVTETGTVALAMVVFIALVTAVTRLLRTSEAMAGATASLYPSC